MKRNILISGTQREIRVAIMEDDELVELQVDRPEARRMIGDIYLGKVEAVLPGIQAAFVDIGTEKSAFLHSSDLVFDEGDDDDVDDDDGEDESPADSPADSPAAEVAVAESTAVGQSGELDDAGADSPYADVPYADVPYADVPYADVPYADAPAPAAARVAATAPAPTGRQPQNGKRKGGAPKGRGGRRGRPEPPQIQDVLKRGQSIIVQVSKEPISTKGPRVTAQVSLAGRFLVFMPFASRVGVSRKIGERAERQRLREQVKKVVPKGAGGVIVRTVGEDVTQETFSREINTLVGQWAKINKKQKFVGAAPKLLHRETSLTRGIIRDLFSAKVDKLTVDSRQIYNEIVEYLKGIAPELIDRVVLHEDKIPLFDKAEIEPEIRDLFKRRCDLPSGGYLIIEPTEALVSIDVNSGRYTGKKDPEKTIMRTNTEAAREIARQLRLRDVGGIIVCDFIDMETRSGRDKLLQELRTHLGRDRARTKAFGVSDLGLIEMTRQRVRQSHLQSMTEACQTCHGTGRVFTPETIVRRMERSVKRVAVDGRKDNLIVKVHPDTALYVLENEKDLMSKLEKGLGFRIEMRDDPLLRPDEFKLVVKGAGRDVTQQYAVA
ncbi:MAG: Rne/Rng family ribonuclease [Gemmatimonadetes bacterium]|nr:Rne/Rng family ribonuclease [Gemmatimonadota bacterium]